MVSSSEKLTLKDWLRFDFFRQLSRILWLFFPAVVFIVAAFFCFWKITQGRDLMIITLENPRVFVFFIIAQFFWAYTTWYTSRIVAKAKELQQPSSNQIWTRLRIQFPRLLAFTTFTIVILGFLQLPHGRRPLSESASWWLLAVSFVYYIILFRLFEFLACRTTANHEKYLRRLRDLTWVIFIALIVLVVLQKTLPWLVIILLVLQAGLVLLLVIRRKLLEAKHQSFHQKTIIERGYSSHSPLLKRIRGLLMDQEDRVYFIVFAIVFAIAMLVYIKAIFQVEFSVMLGSFPFIVFAFGMLLIFGNLVAFFSVLWRFNLHFILLFIGLIFGNFNDSHYTRLPDKQNTNASFSSRQSLNEYFRHWINDPQRRSILESDSVRNYPVYFVLANGGASRSGYWVASVLAELEKETKDEFSSHLFCLSGASGGSVGNATFFTLLRSKNNLLAKDSSHLSYLNITRDYLGTDFLTYTLARMLGPDVFRHINPFSRKQNRADALSTALERASGKKTFFYDSLATGFSNFVTQTGDSNYRLPILCINTTRMQDGSPGVITTISIKNDPFFNDRIDVLDLVDKKKDLKLSSAVVLGASFPYLSPAGRIDHKKDDTSVIRPHYFVDGGYFDNSGAGVVNEMIIALKTFISRENDASLKIIMAKLDFHVLHITNDPEGFESPLPKVNPLVNDLAAPIKTLMGAYGSQTSINDLRLNNYMRSDTTGSSTYRKIPLYRYQDRSINYSMNWVISDYLLEAMNKRLGEKEIQEHIERVKNEMGIK